MMWKRIFVILFAIIALTALLCSCGRTNYIMSDGYEIVYITANRAIEDQSYNKAAWRAISDFCEENGSHCTNLSADTLNREGMLDAVDIAAHMGANVIVLGGDFFDRALYDAQMMYPDISFLALDCKAKAANGTEKMNSNVFCIDYDEIQGGFLAGYCAVMDEYRHLGFIGAYSEDKSNMDYCKGFILGAEHAANELGVTQDVMVSVMFAETARPSSMLSELGIYWFQSKAEVIFTAGGINIPINSAAQSAGGVMIGADANIREETAWDSVIFSVKKSIYDDVISALETLYANGKDWGRYSKTVLQRNIKNGGIVLAEPHFRNYTEENFDKFLSDFADGKITVPTVTDDLPKVEINVILDK